MDNFQVDVESTTTVQGGTVIEALVGDLGFDSLLTFDIKSSDAYANQDIDENDIDSVKMILLRLTIESPADGVDFTFIDELSFFIEGEGLAKQRIAFGGPFQEGDKVIELTVDNIDLKPYVLLETMSITTEVSGRNPSEDTVIRADTTFDIDINVAGVLGCE